MTVFERPEVSVIFPTFGASDGARSIPQAGVPAPAADNHPGCPWDGQTRSWNVPSLSVLKALMMPSISPKARTYQQRRMMSMAILPAPLMPPIVGMVNNCFGQSLSRIAQTLKVPETWQRT